MTAARSFESLTMTVQAMRLHAAKMLVSSGMAMDEAQREARILIEHATGMDITRQVAASETILTDAQVNMLEALAIRRTKGEPIAYLTGKKEFFGLDFMTHPATLIPRPDSEVLVETAFSLLPKMMFGQVLDLGTGTGCLLLSVLAHRPNLMGVGVDMQREAMTLVARNAMQLEVAERVTLHQGSWWDALPKNHSKFDVVLANPPYITTAEMAELMPDVRDHEPHSALHGGEDGLDDYRAILARLPHYLQPGGVVLFEVGYRQAADVAALGEAVGLAHVATKKDMAGHARVVVMRAEGMHLSLSYDSIQ